MAPKSTTLKEFESVFPKLVEDILDHTKQYNAPDTALNWFKAVRGFLTRNQKRQLTP